MTTFPVASMHRFPVPTSSDTNAPGTYIGKSILTYVYENSFLRWISFLIILYDMLL